MSAQFRFGFGLLLAVAMSWNAAAILHARQDKPRETPPTVQVVQSPESAPVNKKSIAVQPGGPDESAPVTKKYTNLFDPLEMQGFSVALLLGEVEGGSTPDNLPAGATKALADVREFLPYKSYRLLDTQWIRCCASSGVYGRLRGLDEQHYTFNISINTFSGQKMTATFSLANEAVTPLDMKKPIIASNFSMETGETVVIGTSSLKGNRALVVLLTAVPRSTTSSKGKKGSLK
jgi:hypothetical protein